MGAIIVTNGGGTGSDDVTATKAQVLEGYTAVTSDSDDEPIEGTLPLNTVLVTAGGTMLNYADWTSNPSSNSIVFIPKGFHNGNGYVNCGGVFEAGVIAGRNNRRTASISSHSYWISSSLNYSDGMQSFTIPSNAINCNVYYAGYSGNMSNAKTGFICRIMKNGVVIESQDGGQDYAIRTTMQNRSFIAYGGDVISVYSYCSAVHTFSGVDAVIVYDLP